MGVADPACKRSPPEPSKLACVGSSKLAFAPKSSSPPRRPRLQRNRARLSSLDLVYICLRSSSPRLSSPELSVEPAWSSPLTGKQRFVAAVTKAVGDSSDSSSESIVKYVQSSWNNFEDRIALAGLGFAAIAAVWASANLIAAIDTLPIIPSTLELIGILFSWWFIYRYLLFEPDREELSQKIRTSISDIIGQ